VVSKRWVGVLRGLVWLSCAPGLGHGFLNKAWLDPRTALGRMPRGGLCGKLAVRSGGAH
jgi:hypothetical protein